MAHPPSGLVEENKYRQSVLDFQGIQPIGHPAAALGRGMGEVCGVECGAGLAEGVAGDVHKGTVTPIPPTVAPPDVPTLLPPERGPEPPSPPESAEPRVE